MREPGDHVLQSLVNELKQLPNLDAVDRLRELVRLYRHAALDDAAIVCLGKGMDLGFNPPHLNMVARAIRDLTWNPST